MPGPRAAHSALWTGSELIVWGGGIDGQFLSTGARYTPSDDTWRVTSVSNAPSPRWFHAAVWTGTGMLIWGGRASFYAENHQNTGGRYDAVSDRWTALSRNGAPTARSQCAVAWTGTEMIIWGGVTDGGIEVNDGARYNPASDTWTPISPSGLEARMEPSFVWTGTELIIHGGMRFTGGPLTFANGARYNPATDSWTPLPTENGPGSRTEHTMVWTGSRVIAWGGRSLPDYITYNTGAIYDPQSNTWSPIPTSGAPAARMLHAAVWTGAEMIVWGGQEGSSGLLFNTGGRYDPVAGSWTPTTQENAPGKRMFWRPDLGIWTGQRMIVAAGSDYPASLASTYLYDPAATNTPPPGTNCPAAPAGMVAWWPFDGDAHDTVGGNTLQLSGGPSFVAGAVGRALHFDGIDDQALAAASPSLNVGVEGGFSIETWINPANVTMQPIAEWTPGPGAGGAHFWIGVYGSGSLFANLVDTGGASHSWRSDTDIVVSNQWQHVAMSYQKSSGLLRFYLNGAKVTEYLLGTFDPLTSFPLAIGYRPGQEHFTGSMDELSVYRRVLADAEIAAIHTAGVQGKCQPVTPPPPQPGYDLARDYSTNANPNGVWSYGWKSTLSGPFDLFGFHGFNFEGGALIDYWLKSSAGPSSVYHNSGPATLINNDGQGVYPPGTVWFGPGYDQNPDNFSIIRFTVPVGGAASYQIRTVVRPALDGPIAGDTDFHVLRNGQELFAENLPANVGTSYSNQIALVAGDTIEFACGRGVDGHVYASALKIEAALNVVTNAPPPPPGTNCPAAPAGMVAWWPFEGDAHDTVSGDTLQLSGGATFVAGAVGRALHFDGIDDQALAAASPSLNVGVGEGFSIETWINPANVTMQPIAEWTPGPGSGGAHFWIGVYGSGSLFANLVDTGGASHSWRSDTDIVVANQWQHVAMSYQKSSGLLRFYLNGAKVTEYLLGTFDPQTSFPLAVGYRPGQEHFTGSMDELSIYRRVLTDAEIAAIHTAGAQGKCGSSEPPPTQCAGMPAGAVAWWPGERNPNDVVGTNRGTLLGDAGYGPGKVGLAFNLPGGGSGVRIPASPALNVGAGAGFTIEGWINPADLSIRGPIVEWNRGGTGIIEWGVHLYILKPGELGLGAGNLVANLADSVGTPHFVIAPGGTVVAQTWQHVALTYERVSGLARLYRNGVPVAEAGLGDYTPETSYDLYLGRRPAGDALVSFRGLLDEITIYDRALPASAIAAIASAGAIGKCRLPAALDELFGLVRAIPAPDDPRPLLATLNAVLGSIQRGNLRAALNQLGAFQNKTRAELGGSDPNLSAEIIALAQFIIETLDPTGARRAGLRALADTPMRIELVGRPAAGAWRVLGCAPPGIACCVQRSDDMQHWFHAGFAVEVDDGSFEWLDLDPQGLSTRFYRLLEP